MPRDPNLSRIDTQVSPRCLRKLKAAGERALPKRTARAQAAAVLEEWAKKKK